MPHVGKAYPVSPARDLSKHVPDFHAQIPLGMMVTFNGAPVGWFSHLNGQTYPSEKASPNYSSGFVLYRFQIPNFFGLPRPFTAVWFLTHDEDFGTWQMSYDEGGFCPIFHDQGTPPSLSLCNTAHWTPPGVGGCFGAGQDFGSATTLRPMTWVEAAANLNLPADLRF